MILSAEHALSLGNAEDSHQKLRGRRVQSFQQLVISYSKDETTFDIAEKGEVGNDQEDEDDNPVFEENISENNTDKLIVSEEGNDDFEFIIGGENVRPGEYPFFVEWERGCG